MLSSRHLSFDDGVFGATADAMRDGARPYRDLFSSQGPLHLPLLYVADLLGLRTLNAPRLLALAAGVVITLGAYLIARRLAGRRAGIVAALLATTSGSILLVTTGISGDGPAIAFAVAAVAMALSYRERPSMGRAVAAGVLVGCALAVKLLAAPVVIPVTVLLWSHRRRAHLVAAGATALAVIAILAAPWGYDRVWDQSVRYHREARRYGVGSAAWRIVQTLVERDTIVTLTAVVVGACAFLRRGNHDRDTPNEPWWTRPWVWLSAWFIAQVGMLLTESAMWRPHVSELVVPLCLLAALALPSWRVLVITWIVAAPLFLVNVVPFVRPGGYRGDAAVLARELRALPAGSWVVGDEPGFAWRTGHRVPDGFIDTSIKRIDQRRITRRDLVVAARDKRTCAVVVWSDERFGRYRGLRTQLAEFGYKPAARLDEGRVVYTRC